MEAVAYHHGEGGKEEAHVEPATLEEKGASFGPGVAPEEGGRQSGESGHGVVKLCEEASTGATTAPELCARYASIFGEAWNFVKHTAKRAWHKFVKIAHYIINVRDKATTGLEPYKGGGEVANGCEVAGFLTQFASPLVKFGKAVFVAGGLVWANC